MSEPKFRVAVCGGGIGGLVCALALSEYPDISVDVYEGAAQFGEIGAGISVWPRPWELLRKLGLENDLLKITDTPVTSEEVPSFTYRKGDQPEGLEFYKLVIKGDLIGFHRAEFQKVLLSHLPGSVRTQCSKRLRSYSQSSESEPIQLVFEDGSVATCDILVGADGLKSSVRRSLLLAEGEKLLSQGKTQGYERCIAGVDPMWTGTISYRTLIPAEKLAAYSPRHRVLTRPTDYVGKNACIVAYPISKGKSVNIAAFSTRPDLEDTVFDGPWVSVADDTEFSKVYGHWEPEVKALVHCAENPIRRWALHTVRPLASFVSGHVVLLGDAAHGMEPFQASGAGQAIEDAYILAAVLGHKQTDKTSITHALHAYDATRRPFAQDIAARSHLNGQYAMMQREEFSFGPENQMQVLHELGEAFSRNTEWAWSSTMDGSLEEAIKMVERSSL